jgi:tetratricopeptide (TPR) repeat protein
MKTDGPDLRDQFEALLKSGDMFALFEHACEAIVVHPNDPSVRYLQALAMARLGDPDSALRLYERNRVDEIETEDAAALKGRLLKDLAVKAEGVERIAMFRKASDAYRRAYRLTGGYFSGLNAATTSFLAGDNEEARQLASSLYQRTDISNPEDYFAAASGAEAMLICGKLDEAIVLYEQARRRSDAAPGMIASTARQVELIANKLSISKSERELLLASIRPSPVIHFCGHMWSDKWQGEHEIADAIRAILDECDVRIAYGSLACGADIVIAEAVLARGGELHIILPFAEADFLKTSVLNGGLAWSDRYITARNAAASVSYATQMRYVGDEHQFAYCSQLTMGLARLRARIMQTEVFQISVWDGVSPDRPAGTSADCAEWKRQGGLTRVVSVTPNRPPLNAVTLTDQRNCSPHTLKAIIFADFFGFSRLDEDCVPQFLQAVMARIAAILDRHTAAVLSRNSWGDAIFVVVTTPEEAANIAIAIQTELDCKSLLSAGLPAEGGMRMSLHYGPIFEHFDAIQNARTFYGTEVTLAARIEPRVPVGAIYTTEPFAAMFEHYGKDYHFSYVGKMDLAKDYGVRTLYRLAAA